MTPDELRQRVPQAAFAFRGYNDTNLGRTPELLEHAAYGSIVAEVLGEASQIASDELGRRLDLVERVRARRETDLSCFADAVALIMAAEVAQVRLLREFFGIEYKQAQFAFGYSLGEISALVCDETLQLRHALPIPVSMADDCAELGHGLRLGILFSRGSMLEVAAVDRLLGRLNLEDRGIIGVSSYLSPNTLLLLGQGDLVEAFREIMHEELPKSVHLRIDTRRWPPLHTPITWDRCVPNRAARRMLTMPTAVRPPVPTMLSMVTGKASYNDHNIRDTLTGWIDQPQRVWDVIYETLRGGVETVIHVGPEPNLLPATFRRISDNVEVQLSRSAPRRFGGRVVTGIARRAWLGNLLPKRSALLRAPFVQQVILEDWLLEQAV